MSEEADMDAEAEDIRQDADMQSSEVESTQSFCSPEFSDWGWEWMEQEMERELREEEAERAAWKREVAMDQLWTQRLAKMEVRYLDPCSSEVHASLPYPPVDPIPFESFREAELWELHDRNNTHQRHFTPEELRAKRKASARPVPPDTLQYNSPREVLLHDLDSSPFGPIALEATQLMCDQTEITDTCCWRDLWNRRNPDGKLYVRIIDASQRQARPAQATPSNGVSRKRHPEEDKENHETKRRHARST